MTTAMHVLTSTAEPSLGAAWLHAHRAVTEELDDVALPVVEGAIPDALRGVLFRNGPGKLEAFGARYGHPFDGDGMVVRFAFGGPPGAPIVRYRNRYVRTRELVAEERARKMLYRGFGTNLPGGVHRNALRLAFKNAANTSVIWHGGRLLALWEAGMPHRLDPVTLDTIGREDFRGALRPRGRVDRVIAPELPFSAHPKIDPRDGALLNFGALRGARPKLLLHRVDADGRMARPTALALDELAFVHDWVVTERWLVFFVPPVAFDLPRTLLGLATPASSIRTRRGAPMRVMMVPRDGGGVVRLEAEPGFVFHFAGAFERADGTVVVDGYRMDRYPRLERLEDLADRPGEVLPPTRLVRFQLQPARRWLTEEILDTTPGELPTTGVPCLAQHRYVYAIGRRESAIAPFFSAVLKVDVRGGATRLRDLAPDFPGEPIFVPRPGATSEDDGLLLTLVYETRTERSYLLVLRADDLSTVARVALPHHVPPGFHGTWVAADGGPEWARS